jgi:hypothetical protein
MGEIEKQDQHPPRSSTPGSPVPIAQRDEQGVCRGGSTSTVEPPVSTATTDCGEVTSSSVPSTMPSAAHQNRADPIQKSYSPSGVTIDGVEQIVRALDLLGFRQKIWVNPPAIELRVNERWVDTALGRKRVIYLSDIC